MATRWKISRTKVDRPVNPKSEITLSSLQGAGVVAWRRVSSEVV